MNVRYPWLLVGALATGILGYLLGATRDEPDPPASTQREEARKTTRNASSEAAPPRKQQQWSRQQAPVRIPPVRGPEPADPASRWSATHGNRFRPGDQRRDTTARYGADAPHYRQQGNGYFDAAPEPEVQGPAGRYRGGQSGTRDLRFRPLEDNEQTRRWRGNYRQMSISPAQLATPGTPGFHVTQVAPNWR